MTRPIRALLRHKLCTCLSSSRPCCSVVQARATRGVHKGTWYFEIKVTHLGTTGHCRLGWSTKKGELQVRMLGMTWSEAAENGGAFRVITCQRGFAGLRSPGVETVTA